MPHKFAQRNYSLSLLGFVLGSLIFISCADKGTPLPDLRRQIQGGVQHKAELMFEARDPVVALADSGQGFLYIGTSMGEIYRLDLEHEPKAERICRGLSHSDNSFMAFAVTKDGSLLVNDLRDSQDVLLLIDSKGQAREILKLSDSLLSLAADRQGKVYLACWTYEGNLSVSLNPRAVAGAEFIKGKIFVLEQNGLLVQIYEGGIPVWLTTNQKNQLIASIWGKQGYFAPEKKNYSYVDPYRAFWLALSDKVQLYNLTTQQRLFANTMVDSLTLFVMTDDDYLFGYGISKDGGGGFYLVEAKRPPIRLLFADESLSQNVTALILFENVVYFGNAQGKVFRIK